MTPEQQLIAEVKENSARLTILVGLERQTQEALKRIGRVLKNIEARLPDLPPYPLSH